MEIVVGRKYRRVHQGNLNSFEFPLIKGIAVTVTTYERGIVHFSPSLVGFKKYSDRYFKEVFEPVNEIYLGGE